MTKPQARSALDAAARRAGLLPRSVPRMFLGKLWRLGYDTWTLSRLDWALRLNYVPRSRLSASLREPLQGDYLISTDKGLFRASGRRVENILSLTMFGISITESTLFAAVTLAEWSFLLRADMKGERDTFRLSGLKLVKAYSTPSHPERVHQIHARGQRIAVASTKTNSIDFIDAATGKEIFDIYPIADKTGFPIKSDHNHINSAYQAGEVTFFVAHDGGALGALIGYVARGRVIASAFPNRGVHDVIPTARGLIFCDTFGPLKPNEPAGGNVYLNGKPLLPAHTDRTFTIRGVAGTRDEWLVGHSHHGKRGDRFKGSGALLVLRNGELTEVADIPCAQIYDIIRADGRKFDDDLDDLDAAQARELLSTGVGPVVMDDPYYLRRSGQRHLELGNSRSH